MTVRSRVPAHDSCLAFVFAVYLSLTQMPPYRQLHLELRVEAPQLSAYEFSCHTERSTRSFGHMLKNETKALRKRVLASYGFDVDKSRMHSNTSKALPGFLMTTIFTNPPIFMTNLYYSQMDPSGCTWSNHYTLALHTKDRELAKAMAVAAYVGHNQKVIEETYNFVNNTQLVCSTLTVLFMMAVMYVTNDYIVWSVSVITRSLTVITRYLTVITRSLCTIAKGTLSVINRSLSVITGSLCTIANWLSYNIDSLNEHISEFTDFLLAIEVIDYFFK